MVKVPGRAEADRFFNYPYEAIEEALSNAVYHKGYDEREPIEARIEKDMIEIISHPGPDRSVTLEGLRTFKVRSRRYRNRRIGEFLKELHLTEGRNTGFKKILDVLQKNGSPLPEFETDESHDYFITRLFIHPVFLKDQNVIEKVPEKVPDKLSEKELILLSLLHDDPWQTKPQLAEKMNVSRKSITVYLKNLKDRQIITRIGSDRKGYWKIDQELLNSSELPKKADEK